MELRPRKPLPDDVDSAADKGKQPMDDSDGKCGSDSDESDLVPSLKSDSDYEAENLDEHVTLDLNQVPTLSVSDSDSDSLAKKIMAQSRKRGRKSPIEIEDLSDVERVLEHGNEAPVDSPKEEKKKKAKKAKKGNPKPVLLWHAWRDEHNRWIDQNLLEDVNLDQSEVMNETAEASSDLIVPLLRYQREWLAWALKQESSVSRGGILADEMGMGKTIQAIALVLAKRELQQMSCEPDEHSHSPGSSKVLPVIKGTLVICPVVAVTQWVSEIDRFTSRGSTKVLVYHGAKRGKSAEQFSEYDFVITTYSIVESEYRRYMMPPKEKCMYCGRSFKESKLAIHQKYHCGPGAIKTEKQSKQAKKKKSGQSSKGDGGLKQGSIKKKKEMCPRIEDNEKSFLHAVKWQRIILDEAHYIKSRHSNTAKAVLALESFYKWALSGTPLQNRVGELYSLVRFLQIVPYSYNLCKDCDCRTLNHSSYNQCSNCPHSSVRHFCWWNKNIATPIQSYGYGDGGKRAMILLKNRILKSIVLRRTKVGRAADLALPPRIVSLRRDSLDTKEQDYYESLYNESQAQFNTYVQENTLTNNYAHIFDLLTRLRQAVDHPYLVVYSPTAAALKGGNLVSNGNVEVECGLCHDAVEDPVVTSCEHTFCKGCLIDFSASLGQVSCPSCSKLLNVDLTSNKDVMVPLVEADGSAKAFVFNQST